MSIRLFNVLNHETSFGFPSSHYYLRSLSRTSGTLLLPRFSGPSRGSQEDFFGRERAPGKIPWGPGGSPRDPPLSLSLPRKSSREPRGGPENLGRRRSWRFREEVPRIWEGEGSRGFREEVPRIWEGEGSRRSEIMNASNNDYWVRNSALIRPLEELLNSKCSTLRGELDSSTPRVFRGFWSRACLGRSLPRKSEKSVKIG